MARREASCLICGRMYTHTDEEAIRNFQRAYFCSLGCAADAGGPLRSDPSYLSVELGRGRPARVSRAIRRSELGGDSRFRPRYGGGTEE